jgi:hypothetical protein
VKTEKASIHPVHKREKRQKLIEYTEKRSGCKLYNNNNYPIFNKTRKWKGMGAKPNKSIN